MARAKFNGSGSKYHSRKTVVNGITFDSKKEADRYQQLRILQQAGEIRHLKLQVEYPLVFAFRRADNGERVRPLTYRADFAYEKRVRTMGNAGEAVSTWATVIEDCKGVRTVGYKMKKKLMLERWGIDVTET